MEAMYNFWHSTTIIKLEQYLPKGCRVFKDRPSPTITFLLISCNNLLKKNINLSLTFPITKLSIVIGWRESSAVVYNLQLILPFSSRQARRMRYVGSIYLAYLGCKRTTLNILYQLVGKCRVKMSCSGYSAFKSASFMSSKKQAMHQLACKNWELNF